MRRAAARVCHAHMNETPIPIRDASLPGLGELVLKSAVVHTITYFVMGVFAYFVFDYATVFGSPPFDTFMRPTDDPIVATGVFYQPVRGALFGAVFFLLRDSLFTRPLGWLVIWAMLVVVGIIDTFAAAVGSIEGMIYMSMPLATHFGIGLIEVYTQSLLLAVGVFVWVRRREWRWFGWAMWAAVALVLLLSASIFVFPEAGAAS